MNYDIRNVLSDKKKLSIIAGVTVVGLTIGSVGLKVHQEKVNPSTAPVSADEVDVKDKMISQLRVENRKLKQQLNAQKTKSNNSSNNVELVPYNVDGSLGGGYNSIPLNYSSTPLDLHEPTVYEPIIEPVEDEPVIEFDVPTGEELDTPIVEPIVNEVVAPPVTPPPVTNEEKVEEGIVEVPNETIKPIVPNEPTKPTVPNEEELEKDNSLDIIKSATYKGKNIAFFVEKYLKGNVTYNHQQINNKHVLTVKGNGLFIRFDKVGEGDYDCTELVKDGQELTGMERDKVLNEIFNIQDGSDVPTPPEVPDYEIPDPSLDKPSDKPVESEQPPVKDDKVETGNNVVDTNTNTDNTGTTPPPVIAPPAPPAPPEQEVVVG